MTNLIVTAATAPIVVAVADAQQVKSKIAMAIVALISGLVMAIAMTAPTNGMVFKFSSTAMHLIAMAATALIVVAVEIQPAHAVSKRIVLR